MLKTSLTTALCNYDSIKFNYKKEAILNVNKCMCNINNLIVNIMFVSLFFENLREKIKINNGRQVRA